jgi:hypothetical protein
MAGNLVDRNPKINWLDRRDEIFHGVSGLTRTGLAGIGSNAPSAAGTRSQHAGEDHGAEGNAGE